ncbi:hypothetical protein BESB_038170 [Besnoitia besnoiti]|uniref:Uncharacterized protein n=1 Tax=Besnoitia besnoiti TaxID=94643 RepID=A0A2A9MHJ4_BESBE|nr:hypothetical protein BESB_038170 [Besnoitia besnoiti]PFH37359.1 hypothetical protein BESB_038170 [Besnoitia besnoiti]
MEVLQAKTKASTDEGRPEAEEASTASHDCNAAGEWKKVCAAPSQDAPAKAGKKTSRKKKFDKNSPSAVTFRLVAASFADPATQQSSQNAQKMALQRVIPPNALKKNRFRDVLPNDLLRVLSPEHFGIHSNLDEENRRLLCDQVYGGDEELLQAAQEALAAKSKQSSSRAGERQQHQPTLDELDEDCYFPKDGYDYSQHLVSLGGGVLD